MPEKTKMSGALCIVLTAVLWSMGGVLIKLIPWNPIAINGARSLVASLVIMIYMRRVLPKLNLPIIMGGLSLSLTNNLFVVANKTTTAANAIILQYTAPLFVVLLSAIVLKKKPSFFQMAAVLAAFGGIILSFLDGIGSGKTLGNVLALISGLTFAGVFFVNRLPGASPEDASLLACLINVVVAIPFFRGVSVPTALQWGSIVTLGAVQFGLAYVLFSIGIKRTTALAASLIGMLEALLNPVWVLIITGEHPGAWTLVGGTIVLTAIVSNTFFEAKRAANNVLS